MRNHLHQCALHRQLAKHEEAQRDKAHVGDGRVSHQLFHIGLH